MLKIRLNTMDLKKSTLLNPNKQQFTAIVGSRGSAKSWLGEIILAYYHSLGFTCIDFFSAPFYENYFWCLPKFGHKKRYPISIIAPESLIVEQQAVDTFNSMQETKYPLVRFIKLPIPTVKVESEQNNKIVEILTNALIQCRDERRILVFNPSIFTTETSMFRTMELLLRHLTRIAYNHFHYLNPEDVGKTSREEMTNHEKSFHKLVFLAREVSQLIPNRLKSDASGESTRVKKSFLEFVRLARHANISGIFDWQNISDAETSVRNQFDVYIVRKWNKQLAGEHFQWLFDDLHNKREKLAEKFKFSKAGWDIANSSYPPIEKLTFDWFYGLVDGFMPTLYKVPEHPFLHKEPHFNWELLTGIPLKHDQSLLDKEISSTNAKASKSDEKALYHVVAELKSRKGKDKVNNDEIQKILSQKQDGNDINWNTPFRLMKPNTFSQTLSRIKKKYEKD